jgi:hypothetical protein
MPPLLDQAGQFRCPLCDWRTDSTGLSAAAAAVLERAAHDHLSEHSIASWIGKIRQLERTRDELQAKVAHG